MKKDVKPKKPITGRQLGELCRLLEERGVDAEIFQRTMIENPDGLCFFLKGKVLGGLFGKTVTIKEENGWVIEIVDGKIFGVALNLGQYLMGNIFRVGDEVNIKEYFGVFDGSVVIKGGRLKITEIKFGPPDLCRRNIIGVDLNGIGKTTHFIDILVLGV